jgi:hypothetical protein
MMKIVENEKNIYFVETNEYDDVIKIFDMYKVDRVYNKKIIDHMNIEGCFCNYKDNKKKITKSIYLINVNVKIKEKLNIVIMDVYIKDMIIVIMFVKNAKMIIT